jgi:hypothetical protein
MKQISILQTVPPSEAQEPNLSLESAPQAPENVLEPASAPTRAPPESVADIDTGYYNQHWGINE